MWSYEHLYLTCFCLFQSHNLAFIFVPAKAKLLIISMVYFRGGEVSLTFKNRHSEFGGRNIGALKVSRMGVFWDSATHDHREPNVCWHCQQLGQRYGHPRPHAASQPEAQQATPTVSPLVRPPRNTRLAQHCPCHKLGSWLPRPIRSIQPSAPTRLQGTSGK